MLSRSTVVLIVFLVIVGIGAIYVAREFRTKMISPAGLRLSSAQRLRNLHRAILAYRAEHAAWPDSRLSLMRDRNLRLGAVAGIAYAPPAGEDPATIILWREEILPGAAIGEPWSGADAPATVAHPPVGHALTLGGTLLELDEAEFRSRVSAP